MNNFTLDIECPAKINLFLLVGNKSLSSGKHYLESLMARCSLKDSLRIETSHGSLVHTQFPECTIKVHLDEDLAHHMQASRIHLEEYIRNISSENSILSKTVNHFYQGLKKKQQSWKTEHIEIHLHKKIPSEAGLGGGSADAAALLQLLSTLENNGKDSIYNAAYSLGDDVRPCLAPSFSLYEGCTEHVHELSATNNLDSLQLLIVKPPAGRPTPESFRLLNRPIAKQYTALSEKALQLTHAFSQIFSLELGSLPSTLCQRLNAHSQVETMNISFQNDFWCDAKDQISSLREIENELRDSEAIFSTLSGSGSAIISVFNSESNITSLARFFKGQGYYTFVGSFIASDSS